MLALTLSIAGILLSSHAFAQPFTQTADDWDFTPSDYAALMQNGKRLRFESDSDWLPRAFQKNILATLNHALDPNQSVRSTDGVNIRDFYHGHIYCKNPSRLPALKFSEASAKEDALASVGLITTQVATESNLDVFIQAVKTIEQKSSEFLNQVLNEKLCETMMVYHTYEVVSPADGTPIQANDSRRNIMTDQSDLQPKHFQAPEKNYDFEQMNDPNSWFNRYTHLLQVAFLIDQNGIVHATQGSTAELSRVVGKPLDVQQLFKNID